MNTRACARLTYSYGRSLALSTPEGPRLKSRLSLEICVTQLVSFLPPTWLQYSYEGMEINNLPVELTVVWNGHFSIDNPAQNKGEEGGPWWGGRPEGKGGSTFRGTSDSIAPSGSEPALLASPRLRALPGVGPAWAVALGGAE